RPAAPGPALGRRGPPLAWPGARAPWDCKGHAPPGRTRRPGDSPNRVASRPACPAESLAAVAAARPRRGFRAGARAGSDTEAPGRLPEAAAENTRNDRPPAPVVRSAPDAAAARAPRAPR